MIATEREGKLAILCVRADSLCDGLADARHSARVFEFANRWVVLCRDCLELMVAIKLDLPAEVREVLGQTSFNEMNWTLVHACLGLPRPLSLDLRKHEQRNVPDRP